MPGFHSVAVLVNTGCARRQNSDVGFFGQTRRQAKNPVRPITLPPVSRPTNHPTDQPTTLPMSQTHQGFATTTDSQFWEPSVDAVHFTSTSVEDFRRKPPRLLFQETVYIKKAMQKLSSESSERQRRLVKLQEKVHIHMAQADEIDGELMMLGESASADAKHAPRYMKHVSKVIVPTQHGLSPHQKQREWELLRVKHRLSATMSKLQEHSEIERTYTEELAMQMERLSLDLRDTEMKILARKSEKVADTKSVDVTPHAKARRVSMRRNSQESSLSLSMLLSKTITFDTMKWKDLDLATAHAITCSSPRTAIQVAITRLSGDQIGAFRRLDVSHSGRVCLSELVVGLDCMEIPWRKFLENHHIEPSPMKLFTLFNGHRKGVVVLTDIFSNVKFIESDTDSSCVNERIPTPESWDIWCRKSEELRSDERKPKWWADRHGVSEIVRGRIRMDAIAARRDWMQRTIQRLKDRGLTDAACRELVAKHLPRGRGPKDREGCKLLDERTVHMLRKKYMEKTTKLAKHIQKVLFEISCQRLDFSKMRTDFAKMVEGINLATRQEETERAQSAYAAAALAAAMGDVEVDPAKMTDEDKQLAVLARECNVPVALVHEVFFILLAQGCNPANDICIDSFEKFLGFSDTCLTVPEIDCLWKSAQSHGSVLKERSAKEKFRGFTLDLDVLAKTQCPTLSFAKMIKWYAEVRNDWLSTGRGNPETTCRNELLKQISKRCQKRHKENHV